MPLLRYFPGHLCHFPDPELQPVGDKSNIPYGTFFHEYKKHILLGAHKPQVQMVLDWFQVKVFARVDPSVLIHQGANDYNNEFDAMYFADDDDPKPADDDPKPADDDAQFCEPELSSQLDQLSIQDEPQSLSPSVEIIATSDSPQAPASGEDPSVPLTTAVAKKGKKGKKTPVLSEEGELPIALELPVVQGRRTSAHKTSAQKK